MIELNFKDVFIILMFILPLNNGFKRLAKSGIEHNVEVSVGGNEQITAS